jgi:hypothetical protein
MMELNVHIALISDKRIDKGLEEYKKIELRRA